ncbi:DnaB-like helicase C-terminal domain-containing protein [Priestia megaterium]
MIEAKLLSKVLDENSFYVLNKYNVSRADFETYYKVFDYLKGYVAEYNQTPDYRTVVDKFEDFDYYPEVNDSFAYLAKTVKSASAKRRSFQLLQVEASKNFKSMSGEEFAKWLSKEAQQIEAMADSSSSVGTNFATNGEERKEWYNENKETRTFSYIPTPYSSLTKWLGGGFELGDMLLLMAYTNKGKSWLGSHIALTAWANGFGVLYYSPELSKKQQVYRLDTLNGHFNNVHIRRGELANEEAYFKYLDGFDDKQETPFIIKTMEDLPQGLTAAIVESDLQMYPNVQMVVIDGFNLMIHEKIGRDGMSATSRKLRQIFGRQGVVGAVIHQTPTSAEKEAKVDEDDVEATIKPPEVTDYSETVALVQDSATVLTFNQKDGIGKLKLAKCREPHVGKVLDLRCNFNLGFITEASPVDIFSMGEATG